MPDCVQDPVSLIKKKVIPDSRAVDRSAACKHTRTVREVFFFFFSFTGLIKSSEFLFRLRRGYIGSLSRRPLAAWERYWPCCAANWRSSWVTAGDALNSWKQNCYRLAKASAKRRWRRRQWRRAALVRWTQLIIQSQQATSLAKIKLRWTETRRMGRGGRSKVW